MVAFRSLLLFVSLLLSGITFSQNSFYIPTAPDWEGVDLNGQHHQLYDYLNQGKIVFMDVFSTWCGPCYSYQQSGRFKDLYNNYGPNGSNQARVFAIETDPGTGIPQLYGAQPLSQGDFVTGTPYPIIDKPRLEEAFYTDGYPSLYCVCPDRRTYSLSHNWSAALLMEEAMDSCFNLNFVHTRIDTVLPESCKNQKNGEIRLSVLNGVAPFQFAWSNGATTQNISGLAGGHYVCTITDAQGKVGKASGYVPKPPDSMSIYLSVRHLNCLDPGDNNGELSAIGENGIPPYSVNWSTGASQYTIQNLEAGFYDLTVTDAYGCVRKMEDIEVRPKYQPVAVLGPNQSITCAQPLPLLNGSASTTFPFDTILWRKPNGTWVTNNPPLMLPADMPGQYRLLVSNYSSACFSNAYVTIGVDTIRPMAEAGPAKQQICSGTPVALQGSGSGTGALSYSWSTSSGSIISGGNTATPMVSGAGAYSLTVTRTQSGCSRSDATTVTVLNQTPTASATAPVLTCSSPAGLLTGTSSVAGSTFKWTGPGGFNSTQNPASVSQAGVYTLTVTGPGGCSATATVTVVADQTVPQVSTIEPATLTCTAPVAVLSAGGPNNANFEWFGPDGFSSTGQQVQVYLQGTYQLVVTGPNGCSATSSVTVSADQAPPQIAIETPGMITCQQQAVNLAAQVIPSNGLFAWIGPNGFSGSSPQVQVSQPGIYELTVTGANGCSATSSVTVLAEQSLPIIFIQPPGILTCNQPSVELQAASPVTGTFTWQWMTQDGHILSGSDTPSPIVDAPGTYVVLLTNTQTGCVGHASVVALKQDPPLVTATMLQPASCPEGADGMAEAGVMFGEPPFIYEWSDGQSTAQAVGLPVGMVSVRVTDASGCSETIQLEITWEDTEIPELVCPASQTVSFCQSAVVYDLPVAMDNCLIPGEVVRLHGPASGEVFPTGTSTVAFQVHDAGANTATCSFTVTVMDPITLTATIQPDPAGLAQGSINVDLSGGLAPFVFAWVKDNQVIANSEDLDAAPAGSYVLTVTDAGGCSTSASYEVLLETSSTGNLLNLSGWKLFPNPATDRIYIHTGNGAKADYSLEMFDLHWTLLQRWAQLPESMEVVGYPAGTYFLRVRMTESGVVGWVKVMVVR